MKECRCAECGYLAVRRLGDRELVETEKVMRENWDLHFIGGSGGYVGEPVCFAMERQLADDLGSLAPFDPTAAVTKQRECKSFVPWQQGYSPKEHKDRQLSIQQAELDAKRESIRRNWEKVWEVVMLIAGAVIGYLFGAK